MQPLTEPHLEVLAVVELSDSEEPVLRKPYQILDLLLTASLAA